MALKDIPIYDIINLAFHGINIFKTEGIENKIKEMEKVGDNQNWDKIKQMFFKGYADENLYDDVVIRLPLELKQNIDNFVEQLINDEEFGGKKIRDNLFQFFATEPDEDKRYNKLIELAKSKSYEEFRRKLVVRGMRTPETEKDKNIGKKIEDLFDKIPKSLEKSKEKIEQSFEPGFKGPLAKKAAEMKAKYEEKMKKEGGE